MNNWFTIEIKDEECILLECSREAYGDIVVPSGVTRIADNAFKDCTKITSLIIPNSVQRIEKNAFSGCTSLKKIDLPKTSASLIGGKRFIGRLILTAID
jgi:hypothetical protein